jgi:hypothetical protein
MLVNKKVMAMCAVLWIGMLSIAVSLCSLKITALTPDTKLFIDPSSISYQTLVLGQRFSINIEVANVSDLKDYELKLSYNTVMLDVVSVTLLPTGNLPDGDFRVDDQSGILSINATYDGNPITTVIPVALASITFKIMNYGQSPLHLYDTTLLNSAATSILHSTVDGMVWVFHHDVAIVNVASSTNETYIGRIVNVTVTAQNDGNVPENFTVNAYYDTTLLGTFEVINLAPSSNIHIMFSWNTSDVAAGYSYVLKAEASIVSYEANTTNNVLVDGNVKVKIIGDVNNDNIVDINDLNAWDLAYGSQEGMPNWNPQADIDNNGIVDKADGMLIIQNYHNSV